MCHVANSSQCSEPICGLWSNKGDKATEESIQIHVLVKIWSLISLDRAEEVLVQHGDESTNGDSPAI